MDWEGQKLAELLMHIIVTSLAMVALITGYFTASFEAMLLIYAAGVPLTALITVPDWVYFNRHPLKWLDPVEAERHLKP